MRWHRCESLTTMLRFVAGREILREITDADRVTAQWQILRTRGAWDSHCESGVVFTDGTALGLVTEHGFYGTDVTPPGESEAAWYIWADNDPASDDPPA
jgi:hypothetical protein